MLIPELYSSQLALQPAGAIARAWTAGQILEATVVRQALDGTVTLRVGNHEVQARTGLALAADQPLTLQVAQSGTQTVLRVLHVSHAQSAPDPATRAAASPHADTGLAQAWRQVLPRLADPQPLLASLAALLDPQAATTSAALPPALAAALRQLALRLPTLASLATPAGLKQALADSGMFLEAHLAQALAHGTPPAVQNDLKAGLLKLVAQLGTLLPAPAPGGAPPATTAEVATETLAPLLRQADGALARIEHYQLQALAAPAAGAAPLIVELPLRADPQPGMLELHIEAEAAGREAGAPPAACSVWLHFAIEPLGSVHARLMLSGESVTIGLWAERDTTAALFAQHLTELDGALRRAGLEPSGLHCVAGAPPPREATAPPTRLLDERA